MTKFCAIYFGAPAFKQFSQKSMGSKAALATQTKLIISTR